MSYLTTTVGSNLRMTWNVDKLNTRFFFENCPPILPFARPNQPETQDIPVSRRVMFSRPDGRPMSGLALPAITFGTP